MPSIDTTPAAVPLPPASALAAVDRTFYEYWDPSADRTVRIVSLARGDYAFELAVDDITLVRESHRSLAEAFARVSGWRVEPPSVRD